MIQGSTEARHPASAGLHALPDAAVLGLVLDAQAAAITAVRPALSALGAVADAAARALQGAGKLAYAGAGSAGLMALSDNLELAGTFGIAPDRTPMLFAGGADALLHMRGSVEDDTAQALADVDAAGIGAGDVVICVSASGATPYTLAVAQRARALGAGVAGLANVAGSALLKAATWPVLLDTGPEIVGGSTRLAAGTAQKAALNLMSVLLGVRLGHVHDGYMVNLVADNAKLQGRALRIVAALAGTGPAAAKAALAAAAGAVKPAVLMARGRSPAEAAAQLTESRGHLAPWLE